MNWRKYTTLIVGCSISLLLLIAGVVFLIKYQSDYKQTKNQLNSAREQLDRLNRRKPYPSQENIALQQQNLEHISAAFSNLVAGLSKGQIAPEPLEPAGFAPMLEEMVRSFYKKASDNGIKLPESMNLGFARYAAGDLPAREAIPRLIVQLKTIRNVCEILFNSRISELKSVEREVFDVVEQQATDTSESERRSTRRATGRQAAPTAGQSGLMDFPLVASNSLYSVERIGISFSARESVVWEVLNALSKSSDFMVISDVQISNPLEPSGKTTPVSTAAAAPTAGGAPARVIYPSHEERIIAGRESVDVKLVIDSYRFNDITSGEPAP